VVSVLESVDTERTALAEALGLEMSPAVDDLQEYYGAHGDTLLQTLLSTRELEEPLVAFSGMEDPRVRDCVEFGLSPLVSLAAKMGVSVPVTESLLRIATVMMDGEEKGRPEELPDMGFGDMTADEIRTFLRTGRWPEDAQGSA
jgi:hypothetical protein